VAESQALSTSHGERNESQHEQPLGGQETRNAVDLLLSGRTRSALDAYRALARRSPPRPELALVVELLAHELAHCTSEDGERCAR
jgi:hypothetical protein